jgi:hypothetical protein
LAHEQVGLDVPPLPCGAELEVLIAERIRVLPPHEASDTSWAANNTL